MIYADYAATTPIDRRVAEKMNNCVFGNASSIHSFGRAAAEQVENARKEIAEIIGADKNEIYFTSGATESDNWALFGMLSRGDHVISSQIEHKAILAPLEFLQKQGVEVTLVPVDELGRVNPMDIKNKIKPNTKLISVMAVNNEIGTAEPIEETAKIASEYGIPFHTDAAQAMGKFAFEVKKQNISLLSASAHKFYGPKGVGFLYASKQVKLRPFIFGGAQEMDKRAGTVNTPGIVGMAEALKIQMSELEENRKKIIQTEEIIKKRVLANKNAFVNGDGRESGIISFGFADADIDKVLFKLDLAGIACSSGAACSAGSVGKSYVLSAIKSKCNKAIRISVSHLMTEEEAICIADEIIKAVKN